MIITETIPEVRDYSFSRNSPYLEKGLDLFCDSKDPVENRIRRLIGELDDSDSASLIYDIPQLVRAVKKPRDAKKKWLIGLYKSKGWISRRTATFLEAMNSNRALPLLAEICLKKANLRESIPLRLRLPEAGTELGKYICGRLKNYGINPRGLKVRYLFAPERVDIAIKTGNDRDARSRINLMGGIDGEELAMIGHGITSVAETTYLANLDRWKNSDKQEKFAVLVYSPDAVEGIGPGGYMKSNGFHAFHFDGSIKKRSLLAVFEK